MKYCALIVCLLWALRSWPQKTASNCDSILNQCPKSMQAGKTGLDDSLYLKDVEILRECGALKLQDSLLLARPLLGMMMASLAMKDNEFTYKTLLQEILKAKSSEVYQKILLLEEIKNEKIDLSRWEEKKQSLEILHLSQADLKAFKDFITTNKLSNLTYKQAYSTFINSRDNIELPKDEPTLSHAFLEMNDYQSALIEAKKSGKLLLIHFSGYADINSRRMEAEIFTQASIKKILEEKFISYRVYTDDKTPLEKHRWYNSATLKKTISTVGEKFQDLQATKFENNTQPYFVIVDENEKIIARSGFLNTEKDFLKFLHTK